MSSVANITNNATQAGNDKVYNPNSQLDKNAFMKLFLKQLEMQDPTNPMDTNKMLEQTAYLSTMEMNANMQKTIDTLAKTLTSTNELSTVSAIGKMADTGNRYINVTDNDTKKDFELYFGDNIQSGKVQIKDKAGNIVKEFDLNPHTKGILSFEWDLKDNNGNRVKSDSYEVSATYTDPNGNKHTTAIGAYPIESIRFENGNAFAKLGNQYVPFDKIKEIYQWQG
ncbi:MULTISPECIES: flagellar hook capping FlgD N-terminal domain-containing protein [unclassified Lebetimonas]|uniref:flagellar hook capping FlgD N-terminal domain-containing protein n=1 Tax=unclassified Lebetimonas TaxID=2648158 RepID=UPI0004644F1E|nr:MULTISPECIES: flagellar hook capping FlgD N-terminal domain-containing protein [unclassified Lebetimonas]